MRRTLSRLISGLRLALVKTDPGIFRTLSTAAGQQAVFQLEIQQDRDRCFHHLLSIRSCTREGLVLTSSQRVFMVKESWENKIFLFRFLLQTHPAKPPLLHKFRSRILRADKDRKTITVAVPRDIIALEQRRNVRIKPHRRHLPALVLWGVHKNQNDARKVSLHHHVILDLPASSEETHQAVRNISAGGVRLSLPPRVLAQNKDWLETGRKVIVQLVFSGNAFPKPTKHMFVAKVCNCRTDGTTRPELGIQFLAARMAGPKPFWKPLEKNGCEQLARVIHALQVEYYSQAKQRLAEREGSLSVETEQASRPRKSA
ncbi:MAG: PilZ domain-containing protein [Acidobacteriota bacterium]